MMPVVYAKWITSATLVIVGVIHLLPITGVAGGPRLTALYGLESSDANLEILLRHRAVLFGLLGAFLVYAAFRQSTQPLALIAGFLSVGTFLWLAYAVGDFSSHIARVVTADIIALACLVIGSITYLIQAQE